MAGADTELSVLWAVGLSLLGIGLVHFHTSSRRLFIAPAFLAIVFGTSYPVSFVSLVNRAAWIPFEGWGSIGRFTFTNDAMARPFQIVVAGILGLAAGTMLSELVWSGLRNRKVLRSTSEPSATLLLLWGLACIGVILTCAVLGIGRVGLSDRTALPLRLGGILVFARSYFLPVLGAGLVQRALEASEQRRLMPMLLILTAVAGTASLGALSRGLAAFYVAPVMVFAVSRQNALGKSLRRFVAAVALMIVLLMVVGFVSSLQRTTLYSGQGWMGVSEMIEHSGEESGTLRELFYSFGDLIGGRLSGAEPFLAVISGPGQDPDPWIPVDLFMGDSESLNGIIQEALGIIPAANSELAFGIAVPLWGVLGMGGTYLAPFFGTALLIFFACLIEGLLARYGEDGMGAVFGCLFLLNNWESPSLFNFSRVVPVVIAVIVLARQRNRALMRSAFADPALSTAVQQGGSGQV